MLNSLRHPRKRGISVGPQSEADAREFIASREKRRRDSRSSTDGRPMTPMACMDERSESTDYFSPPTPLDETDALGPTGKVAGDVIARYRSPLLTPGKFPGQPLTPPASDSGNTSDYSAREEEEEKRMDHAMFLALQKPRVRYDVEVVTKLVVYAGIAWLAVEGNPLLFEATGLGMANMK